MLGPTRLPLVLGDGVLLTTPLSPDTEPTLEA
jgi:hypothetical protein